VKHPLAERDAGAVPAAVAFGTEEYAVVDGTIQCPDDVADALRDHYADRYEWYEADTTDTCDAVKTDGEVCGRDLPCPYHTDEET